MAEASAAQSHLRLVAGGDEGEPSSSNPLGQLDDAQLVRLVRQADSRAFEILYRRHAEFAFNLAVRVQGSGADVDDVVHDAFLKAYHHLSELRDPSRYRSWLGAIVVRLVRTRIRRRRLLSALGMGTSETVDLDAIASDEASPESRAQLAQVYALLQTMPASVRIAWTLRYIERHRLETVAELIGCSLATAKRRILKAQRFLQSHFVAPYAEDLA